MCMSRHVWGATRAAVRPRFLRASQGCVVVCVYEYEIILSTIFPEIFPKKKGLFGRKRFPKKWVWTTRNPELCQARGLSRWVAAESCTCNSINRQARHSHVASLPAPTSPRAPQCATASLTCSHWVLGHRVAVRCVFSAFSESLHLDISASRRSPQ
jgi:hypothetical protein